MIRERGTYPEQYQEWNADITEQAQKATSEAILNRRPAKIEQRRSEEILENTAIHGDRFNGELLSAEHLKREGLAPKHLIYFGERKEEWVAVSPPYDLSNDRIAVMGYVSFDNGKHVTARSYYRSNSHGLWRYLPSYLVKANNPTEIMWYGKSHDEQSINVPLVVQKSFARISRAGEPLLTLENPSFVFAGTSREGFESGKSHASETALHGIQLRGNFYGLKNFVEYTKRAPEDMLFEDEKQQPQFKRLLATWEQQTGIYGTITVETFPSHDSKLMYMFCRDARNRAWIGGIDNIAKIGSTGVRTAWVDGGDLTTPAYEYYQQTGGYGNEKDTNGRYQDMFANYLSSVPIIRDYIVTREIPPFVPQEQEDVSEE